METGASVFSLLMDFEADNIGAKQGDRIGLQLLYVDQGWKYIGADFVHPSHAYDNCRVMLSNRIDFVAGDEQ